MDRPTKRPKLDPLHSLTRSITPPPPTKPGPAQQVLRSPFQLTRIRALFNSPNNTDTVSLHDLLGNPLIRECWQFNFMIDVDFVMGQFDEDVRDSVTVRMVHGSWKRESELRIAIEKGCARYKNVEPVIAYMPEPFGTHHSKMMVLFRRDDVAQVVIHTANMIPGDWENMTQAVWVSPLLPLKDGIQNQSQSQSQTGGVGSGARFKRDLLAYLNAYGPRKTGSLVSQLARYDFSGVRAALVASVPSKKKVNEMDSDREALWGWPSLKDTLRHVPAKSQEKTPHIVVQVSSIASLGQTQKWLNDVLFDSLSPGSSSSGSNRPKYSIIFPTPDEIRRSLNGYASGGSIHMKLQSAPQQKQLQYMRPYLCQWAGDTEEKNGVNVREAGRRRAAPHIKTYFRFSDTEMDSIDWAMVTSANLSTQAWGAVPNAHGEVRICSWEIGVIVWPDLYEGEGTKMVPCFKQDLPEKLDKQGSSQTIIGLRMPYDLPLTPYSRDDVPWCVTATHTEPDWLGRTWT